MLPFVDVPTPFLGQFPRLLRRFLLTNENLRLANFHLPFSDSSVLHIGQAFGRAYGTGRSQAHSPCLQHTPQLVGGVAPKPPFSLIISLPVIIYSLISPPVIIYSLISLPVIIYSLISLPI